MVRSTPQNANDNMADNWVQIGALIPMSPRTPYITSRRRNSITLRKRRYVPSKTMVKSAIKTLIRNPRIGVSFMAIKKFITQNYYDAATYKTNRFHFVKRYIKKSLEKGELIRTKGVGVCGSFRLPHTQQIIKKKLKKDNKKKQQRNVVSVQVNRKQEPKQLKEKDVSAKQSRATVESNTKGGSGGGGGDADENVSSMPEKVVKAISKASMRKARKSNETES